MADKKAEIDALQAVVTGLASQSYGHRIQGLVFGSKGLSALATKYATHAEEEMAWVEKFANRILDLGGEVKVEKHEARALCYDPIEYIKEDLKIQEPGVELLRKCMGSVCEDYLTFDILKAYLADEEEDLYWSQGAVEMIEKIGAQNWLIMQL
jgi:bacterioferritin